MSTFSSQPASQPPRTDLVATLTDAAQLERLGGGSISAATWLEVRADLVGDVDFASLRDRFDGQLLYTLRSRAEGGLDESSPEERRRRLLRAAGDYDLVDFELERDRKAAQSVAEERRLLSWHDPVDTDSSRSRLNSVLAGMDELPARFRKLIPMATSPAAAALPIRLLAEKKRADLICFAMGKSATWTRVVAPRLGSALTYGAVERAAAPGQFTLEQLVKDYHLPSLRPIEALFGIVGDPVQASLSPRIHNGAYADLDLPFLFLPFQSPTLGEFWLDIVEEEVLDLLGAPLRGLSVTAPHKKAALALAGASSPRAQRIDSANTLVRREGVWEAESTDPEGISYTVARRRRAEQVEAEDKGAALVVGTGGAGRAAVLGLLSLGYEVSVSNRTEETGRAVAQRLGAQFLPATAIRESDYEVLVNATSLGRDSEDRLPLDPGRCRQQALVIDMVYGPEPTPLEQAAQAAGVEFADGREVLLMQAVEQFQRMTAARLPVQEAAARIGLSDVSSFGEFARLREGRS